MKLVDVPGIEMSAVVKRTVSRVRSASGIMVVVGGVCLSGIRRQCSTAT